MFTCSRIRKKFYEYHEGDLSITGRIKVDTHLKKCISCSEKMLQMEKLFELLPKEGIPKLSEEFWRRFNAELKNKISSTAHSIPSVAESELKPEVRSEVKRYRFPDTSGHRVQSIFPALNLKPAFSFALVLIVILIVGVTMGRLRSGRITVVQSERQLSTEELLLEELYLLDELSPEDVEDLNVESLSDEELEDDIPFLYELDPSLLGDSSGTG